MNYMIILFFLQPLTITKLYLIDLLHLLHLIVTAWNKYTFIYISEQPNLKSEIL